MDDQRPLAECLSEALEHAGMTVEELAERTKIPGSTVRTLLGSTDPAILPQRVYLRGQVIVIARELALDVDLALRHFDVAHPRESQIPRVDEPRFNVAAMAVAAGLAGIGIIAVILAFAR